MKQLIMMVLGGWAFAQVAGALEPWDFGRIAYGAIVKDKPSFATSWECDEGCSLTDDLGVEYEIWEGNKIVVKRFVVKLDNRDEIPFGIDYASDVQSVVRKIEQKTGKSLDCDRHDDNNNIPPGTLFCHAEVIQGDPGVFLFVTFGSDGRLQEIEIFTKYM